MIYTHKNIYVNETSISQYDFRFYLPSGERSLYGEISADSGCFSVAAYAAVRPLKESHKL
uniref:Uncharacterized protein n=1 Tax=Glossina palpalis gambiensis TaxID=67801 RepID=A0A1B0B826_9MUSC